MTPFMYYLSISTHRGEIFTREVPHVLVKETEKTYVVSEREGTADLIGCNSVLKKDKIGKIDTNRINTLDFASYFVYVLAQDKALGAHGLRLTLGIFIAEQREILAKTEESFRELSID